MTPAADPYAGILARLRRAAERILLTLSIAFALGLTTYHLYVAYFGPPQTEIHRSLHFALGIAIVFCLGRLGNSATRSGYALLIDTGLLAFVLGPVGYLILNIEDITGRMIHVSPVSALQFWMSIALVVAVLEVARRLLGWAMVILASLFLIYTQVGPYLPYPFWHRGYPVDQVAEQIYLSLDGLWGLPIGASANYIFLFVLFGALLVQSGAGAFFSRFANACAGRATGGPAKTAVLSSAFMSMLSGSSTANVVTTGSFTIPAMKSYGYRKEFAGGVEALASTGGLITPPVMGAAAFIMADFLGVAYSEIMAAAAIPAILYFSAIFLSVDLEARRNRLAKDQRVGDEPLLPLLKEGAFMLIPLAVMIYFLVLGFTPAISGLYGVAAFVATLSIRNWKRPRETAKLIYNSAVEAPKMMAPVIAACAIGGIIAGIISLTGLGVRFTSIITLVAGDSRFLFLLFTMIVSIILGMGMPTSAVYIVLAAILAPGLIDLGFEPIAAHMFIFFGAVMSNITPPLAIASFAAAAVAGSDPLKTSVAAVRIAAGVFFVPFVFSYSPALLGVGSLAEIAVSAGTALLGILLITIAMTGWFVKQLGIWVRTVLLGAAVALMLPGGTSDLIGVLAAGLAAAVPFLINRLAQGGEIDENIK